MPKMLIDRCSLIGDAIRTTLARVEVLALFPLLMLVLMWSGATDWMTASAFLLPTLLALQAFGRGARGRLYVQKLGGDAIDPLTRLPGQPAALAMLARAAGSDTVNSACLLLQIDDWPEISARLGREGSDDIIANTAARLVTTMRGEDMTVRLGDARFGVVLHPGSAARLGTIDAIATRLQAALGEPIAIGGTAVHPTVSIGHALLAKDTRDRAGTTFAAAESALDEAMRNGPAAIRAHSPGAGRPQTTPAALADDVAEALKRGQIRAWFQPQVSTDTGVISGFEALARWHHPERGLLMPSEFLPAIDAAGKMSALGEMILLHSLTALQAWDRAGLRVPSVAVNFSSEELRDPTLADRIKWEVDRLDLRPGRLTIEILETVAARSEDDAIIRNIQALGAHGFHLDLDDFGTGQASIANIRRFRVNRIKIDRSFVTRMDQDPEQQAMVSAILAMAAHLNVETIAEGVETPGEHAALAQLGCAHVQGFGIARPMPFEDTIAWATRHNEKLTHMPRVGRRTG